MHVAPFAKLVSSRWAPWLLLAVSLLSRVVVTLLGAEPYNMIDLKVYVEGAQHLTDGRLYDFLSGNSALPFTYPPFSALIFRSVSWLPFTLIRVLWQVGMLACLPALIYLTLRLLGRAGPRAERPVEPLRGILIAGTALAYWLEPVSTTFNYGQINLFLALIVVGGAVATRDWVAGAGVGLAAGIKLIPAITGLYYLLQRRLAVVVWAAVSFAATIGVVLLIIPAQTRRYFTKLIFDPSRTGQVFSAINQSWRGALSRLAGHDVSTSWALACGVTLLLGVWSAWAAAGARDRVGSLMAVQFTGLLVSPISWSHHWVWVLPLLLWGLFGPLQDRRAVRILVLAWLAAAYSYVIPILVVVQGTIPTNSRPGWQSWLGSVYAVLGMSTLVVIGLLSRAHNRRSSGPQSLSGPEREARLESPTTKQDD